MEVYSDQCTKCVELFAIQDLFLGYRILSWNEKVIFLQKKEWNKRKIDNFEETFWESKWL